MTEPERKIARARINEARRIETAGEPLCAHCTSPFTPSNPLRVPQRIYCSVGCKRKAWLLTPKGRVWERQHHRLRNRRVVTGLVVQ